MTSVIYIFFAESGQKAAEPFLVILSAVTSSLTYLSEPMQATKCDLYMLRSHIMTKVDMNDNRISRDKALMADWLARRPDTSTVAAIHLWS